MPAAGRISRGSFIVAVVALGAMTATATAPAATLERPCSVRSPGIVPTLGSWTSDGDPITAPERFGARNSEESYEVRVYGLDAGLGRLAAGTDRAVPAFRSVRSRSRVRTLALCEGHRTIARFTHPDPEGQIGGVSVNGTRIAWRTWKPESRGTLTVGRIRRGRIIATRRVRIPALPSKQRVNGRILVMPDGSAAWSLPTAKGPAVWLWPAGRAPRRLVVPGRARRPRLGWDVRIVDDRHVLLGDTDVVARYGPPTPGRCPTPMGASSATLDGRLFVAVQGARYFESSDSTTWSQSLICDPRAGDYLHVHASSSTGTTYGTGFGTSPEEILTTAGVAIEVDRTAGDASRTISEIVNLTSYETTVAVGYVDGVDTRTASPFGSVPATDAVRVQPGVVAWISTPRGKTGLDDPLTTRSVMLADAGGVRTVGTIPASLADPALTLDHSALHFSDGIARKSVPVTPTAETTIGRLDR